MELEYVLITSSNVFLDPTCPFTLQWIPLIMSKNSSTKATLLQLARIVRSFGFYKRWIMVVHMDLAYVISRVVTTFTNESAYLIESNTLDCFFEGRHNTSFKPRKLHVVNQTKSCFTKTWFGLYISVTALLRSLWITFILFCHVFVLLVWQPLSPNRSEQNLSKVSRCWPIDDITQYCRLYYDMLGVEDYL